MTKLISKRLKILVIDDDEFIRLTIANIMKKTGCIVFQARDGHEGITLFKKEQPDLIITDILMPDKEGLETIQDLRRLDSDIKIIAMSGGGSTQNMAFLKLAQKMGANITMSKPIKPDELLRAVKSIVAAEFFNLEYAKKI